MDLTGFDRRAQADEGVWIKLKHDITDEVLQGDDGLSPEILVRAGFGRKASKVRKKMGSRILGHEALTEATISQDLDALQDDMFARAYPLIADIRNVSLKNIPLELNEADMMRLCDLSPIRTKTVRVKPKDEDGNDIPDKPARSEMTITNKPFAMQIIEASNEFGEDLGNE